MNQQQGAPAMNRSAHRVVLHMAMRHFSLTDLMWLMGAMAGAAFTVIRDGKFGVVAALVVGGLLAALAITFAGGLAEQNRPRLARLVPGHVALLRRTLQVGLAVLLGLGLLAAAALGGDDPQRALRTTAMLLPLILWAACCAGGRRWWLLLAPAAAYAGLFAATVSFDIPVAGYVGVLGPLACLALLLGGPLLLRGGTTRHMAAHDAARRHEAIMNSLQGGSTGALYQIGWMASLMRLWLLPLRAWLQRRSPQPVQGPHDAVARALWLVSPSLVGWQQLWSLLLLGLMLVGPWVGWVLLARAQGEALYAPAAWPVGALLGVCLLTVVGSRSEHWSSRNGQAVLRLLPHLPTGNALALAWRSALQRHALLGWLATSVVALLATVWVTPAAWPASVLACLLALPAVAALVRTDWPRLPRPVTPTGLAGLVPQSQNPVVAALGWAVLTAVPVLLQPLIGQQAWALWAAFALGLACVVVTAVLLRKPTTPLDAPWPVGRWA